MSDDQPPALSTAHPGSSTPSKIVVPKALCYVVRDDALLVIEHPDHGSEEVGLQVPGGTIRVGETAGEAALREAREETGLHALTIVEELGETEYDITPHRFEIHHRHVFHLALHEDTPYRWTSHERHDGTRPPTRLRCSWIPLASAHVLQSGQGALLGLLYERLLEARSGSSRPTDAPGRRPR